LNWPPKPNNTKLMNNYRNGGKKRGEQIIITDAVQAQTQKNNESAVRIYPSVNGHNLSNERLEFNPQRSVGTVGLSPFLGPL